MLRNHWYIACASSRLESTPRAAKVCDDELVLFRDAQGAPHALLDRCCHRGVRLSRGRVCGGKIACGYHGWQYDGSGQCVHIPALLEGKRIPRGFVVPSFPCVEQDAYIWVWIGDGPPSPERPARIPELQEPGGWRQGEAHFKCSNTMVIENQFDIIHPAFVHVGTHPAYYFAKALGPRDEAFEVRVTEKGLIAFAPVTESASDPIPDKPFFRIIWELPDRVWVKTSLLTLLTHVVPTGAGSCRMEWIERKKANGSSGIVWDGEAHLLTEQDRIMETAQEWYDRCGSEFERSIEIDFVTLLVRTVTELAHRGEWNAKRGSLTQRRVLNYRLAAAEV
jgi:nitrite reductase/ring-hydroxylating ferredoxin subunit